MKDDYWKSTSHPIASVLFVLPLLIAYEVGIHFVAPTGDTTSLRNGADVWVRAQVKSFGLNFAYAVPVLLAAVLVGSALLRWRDRPKRPIGLVFGMFLECTVFAVALWALWRNFIPLLEQVGVPLNSLNTQPVQSGSVLKFIGAGIYEEVLFRLILLRGLAFLLQTVLLPKLAALLLSAVLTAIAFAACHHVGQLGDPLDSPIFLFRTVSGIVFALLYLLRGLGVAVGTHAAYNMLVGVSVQ
jgi:membrane protease YdiL (CAAX protease family)